MGSSSSKPEPSIRFLKLGGKYKVNNKIVTVYDCWNTNSLLVKNEHGLIKPPYSYYIPADTVVNTSNGQYKLYKLSYATNESDYVNGNEVSNLFSNFVTIKDAIDPTILSQIKWKEDDKNFDQKLLDTYFKKTNIKKIDIYYCDHYSLKLFEVVNNLSTNTNIVWFNKIRLSRIFFDEKIDFSIYTFLKYCYIRKKDVEYAHLQLKPVSTPVSKSVEPVSTPISTSVKPVSTPISTSVEPVSTSVSIPVSTPVSTSVEPVSTPVSTPVEPVSTPISTSSPVSTPVEPVSTSLQPTLFSGGKTKSKKKLKKSKKNKKKYSSTSHRKLAM